MQVRSSSAEPVDDVAGRWAVLISPPAPGIVLPWLVRIATDTTVLEDIPVHADDTTHDGRRVLRGVGAWFAAEATWRPLGLSDWSVTLALRCTADRPIEAGVVVALRLPPADDPAWLIPGLFYGTNGPVESAVRYPRFARDGDPECMESPAWSFRADRAATPAVFAWSGSFGAVLATTETGQLGLQGLGFAWTPESLELRLTFPYREEPVVYDGSPDPHRADVQLHRWLPDEEVALSYRAAVLDGDRWAWRSVHRDLDRWLSSGPRRVAASDLEEVTLLAADGLVRWHDRPRLRVLLETIDFDRGDAGDQTEGERQRPGDRQAMHVGWLSGTPPACALVLHGLRTGDARALEAGRRILDHIAASLAPCGTFWGQWSADRGWSKGWTPGPDEVHARTLGEATLFMIRAAVAAGRAGMDVTGWRSAIGSNCSFVRRIQRPDGALPASWNARTGEPGSWAGTACLAWIPALIEAASLLGDPGFLEVAGNAGAFYAPAIERGELAGAPEDTALAPTSEDGYIAVMASVALLEAAPGDQERDTWLALARRAADWTLSFRYAYDVALPPDSTLGRRGFRTRGADQASPANEHLHGYGLVCLPEMVRLARLTGDDFYLDRTRDNLACFLDGIVRFDGDLGGRRGMVPERWFQTAYGGPKGEIGPLSHAWCLGLLLFACESVIGHHPELTR
jgi:hypothetical protein